MAPPREVLGVALIAGGVQCSVAANTVVKLLAAVPMLQLMQARFLLQWTCSASLCVGMKLCGQDIRLLGPPECRRFLLVRATTYTGALMALWCALRYLPVGEATAIVYLHPVLCGLMAHFLLHEPLGRIFWVQAGISCLGVALVADLSGALAAASSAADVNGQLMGKALALLACVCFASGNCVVRLMPRCHPLEVQVFTDSLIALVAMPVVLHLSGSAAELSIWTGTRAMLLVVFTTFGISTSFLAISGFKLAPATIAALFMYLEVPSSFAVQVFFFDQVPGPAAVCGALLITVAAAARLVYEALPSSLPSSPKGGPASPDSPDLDDEPLDLDIMDRQGTLEACLGPYILARKTSIPATWQRRMTEDNALMASLFSPLVTSERQQTI